MFKFPQRCYAATLGVKLLHLYELIRIRIVRAQCVACYILPIMRLHLQSSLSWYHIPAFIFSEGPAVNALQSGRFNHTILPDWTASENLHQSLGINMCASMLLHHR